MKKSLSIILLLVLGLLVLGLLGLLVFGSYGKTKDVSGNLVQSIEPYTASMQEVVKITDWNKLQTVEVEMDDFYFKPDMLIFKVDMPYKLVIKNEGKEKHYFTSTEFFKAIATRKVEGSDGEIKVSYLTAIEVFPEKKLEIYFVPQKKGEYFLRCTIEGHEEKGMYGKIIIE